VTKREILETVDQFDWSSVEHAYGPATDVPEILRTLADGNKKAREEAWYMLYGNLLHQGTLYSATPRAVPYFLQLIPHLAVEDQVRALCYIASLYRGEGYWSVHQSLSALNQPSNMVEEIEKEQTLISATRAAVAAGTPLYLKMLDSRKPGPRIAAAYLLGLLQLENVEDDVVIERVECSALK
jgi:hypothetical protein